MGNRKDIHIQWCEEEWFAYREEHAGHKEAIEVVVLIDNADHNDINEKEADLEHRRTAHTRVSRIIVRSLC